MTALRIPKRCNLDDYFHYMYTSSVAVLAKVLKELPSPNVYNSSGKTLLHKAIQEKDLERLDVFLQGGCDVNASCSRGESPLHTAVICGQLDTVRRLLEAGANTEARCGEGSCKELYKQRTPLQCAVLLGHHNIAVCLIEHKCAVDKDPLLQIAIKTKDKLMLKVLLEAGCDVDLTDESGRTALARALFQENMDIVKLLLTYKPDLDSLIPLDWFQSSSFYCTPLMLAIFCGDEFTQVLLKTGADPNGCRRVNSFTDVAGWDKCFMPVCLSTKYHPSHLRHLIAANCKLYWKAGDHCPPENKRESDLFPDHDSAMFYAIHHSNKKAVQLLFKCGFDLHRAGQVTHRRLHAKLMRRGDKPDETCKLLQYHLRNPVSLVHASRNIVREHIGIHPEKNLKKTNLPPRLINIILLKDVLSIEL